MSTLKALYDKVGDMDINSIIDKSIDSTVDDLAEINRQRMLDGVRADGSTMPIYSFISQTVYGYPNEPIKLKNTGAFQAGLTTRRKGDIIETLSTDSKSSMLEERYGEEYGTSIFGTSGPYKKEYLDEHLKPELHKNITAASGLNFK